MPSTTASTTRRLRSAAPEHQARAEPSRAVSIAELRHGQAGTASLLTGNGGCPHDREVTESDPAPNLSFIVPGASENRWSDLLAVLLTSDPSPLAALLGVEFDSVSREVSVSGPSGRADRLDLLLQRGGTPVAAIEVKLLSDLGPQQLTRYAAAFPDAGAYRVLHLAGLPVVLRHADPWKSVTWEEVLDAYAVSTHTWVSTTARAWRTQLATLVPVVDAATVWNDVPADAAGMELALRARVAWLSRRMDSWSALEHDLDPSSGGGNWAVRMWAPASKPDHVVTAEIQEGMTAYEWKPDPVRPYSQRLKGPVVLLGLRQDFVTTSAGFDWALLHKLFKEQILDETGSPHPGYAWQTTAARPSDPTDKEKWKAIVDAGAPAWLGKGWGMKVAQGTHSCLFGARLAIPPNSTLGQVEKELVRIEALVARMASHG